MVDEETNTKEDLPPRSFGIVFGCWLLFAIFSILKGMKYFRWPQPPHIAAQARISRMIYMRVKLSFRLFRFRLFRLYWRFLKIQPIAEPVP